MDFHSQINNSFVKSTAMPFFMTYPGYVGQEKRALKDFEYFQQTYPAKVKNYQKRIQEILDKMDYEGAMIYDEYPDRYQLEYLANTVADIIEREEKALNEAERREENTTDELPKSEEQNRFDDKGRMDYRYLIQILVINEIFKRRHNGKRDYFYY